MLNRKHGRLQRDSNSDRRSRRHVRWPLDHDHGPLHCDTSLLLIGPFQYLVITCSQFQVQSRLENPTKYHMIESQRRQISQFLNGNDKSDDPIPGTSASSFLALPRQNVHPRSAPEHSDPPKRSKHEFVTNSFPDDLGFCSTSAPCPAIISTQTSTIPGNSAAVDGGAVAAANDANANAIVKVSLCPLVWIVWFPFNETQF